MPRYTDCLNWPSIYIYIYVSCCNNYKCKIHSLYSITNQEMNPLRSQNSLQQYKTRQNRENKTEKPFFFFFFWEAKKKRLIKCKRDVISSGQMTIKSPMQQNCLHYSNFLRWINLAAITINAKSICYVLLPTKKWIHYILNTHCNSTKQDKIKRTKQRIYLFIFKEAKNRTIKCKGDAISSGKMTIKSPMQLNWLHVFQNIMIKFDHEKKKKNCNPFYKKVNLVV